MSSALTLRRRGDIEMQDRLEMVVGGRRQAAVPVVPVLAGRVSAGSGFFMESQRVGSFELPDHWIPYYMVGVQFANRRTTRYLLDGGKIREDPIHDGSCVVVVPQEIRRFRIEGDAGFDMVSIEPTVFQEIAGFPQRSPLELVKNWSGYDPVLKDLLLRLRAEAAAGFPAGALPAESICIKITEELVIRFSIGKARLPRYKGGLSGVQLRRALEFIDAYLDSNLDAASIAGVAGLSKYHFGKAFRQSTGMSLHNYVLARRMKRSQELLAKSDLPLAVIAQAAGFSNQSHFTTVFSTRTGISPTAFRNEKRRTSVSLSEPQRTDLVGS
jgi:AraC family transcriptional regulator